MSGPVLAYLRDVGTADDPCWVPCAKDDPGCVEFCDRAVVAEQQTILRQLVAWNRNVNGEGSELDALCAAAELLVGRPTAGEPCRGADQLAAVAGLVEAVAEYFFALDNGQEESDHEKRLRATLSKFQEGA